MSLLIRLGLGEYERVFGLRDILLPRFVSLLAATYSFHFLFFFFFFPLYLGSSIHSPNSMGPDKDVKASKDDAMKKEIKAEG